METLSDAIAAYIEQRKQTKLEPLQKKRDKALAKELTEMERAQIQLEYAEAAKPFEEDYMPQVWLVNAAKRAKQISLATHAAKFTHSDAKASSALILDSCVQPYSYVTTVSLKDKAVDVVGNAAALDVAKLLKLEVNGESLVNQLKAKHVDALKPLITDESLLEELRLGFEKALIDDKLSSHNLSKQLYFPVHTGEKYHLLCPLFSSAMAHRLHQTITASRFGESKDIREARRNGHYDERTEVSFPKTAVQTFGGTKPQNISQLNSERYGQVFLLNAAPPTYQRLDKPPSNSKTLFNREFNRRTYGLVKEFKQFLAGLGEYEKNFKVRYKRDYYFVLPLIEQLLQYATEIQNLSGIEGWSTAETCELEQSYCLWLDAQNPDVSFQQQRQNQDYLSAIAKAFAKWLNSQLSYNNKAFKLGDIEFNYFQKLCLHELKAFERNGGEQGVPV